MKKLLKYLSALAFAVVMAPAHAINVGGVVWDPNSIFDFSATDTMIESQVNAVGDTLNGYAKIVNINGETNQNVFCPGCEVTYVFSGYTLDKITAGGDFVFTGGTITVYVDDTPDYNSLLQSTAADGAIWLVLDGALHVDGSTGELGTLHSDPTPTATGVEGDGRGFLHVTGGLAAANFDTNTFPIIIDLLGTEGFADFLFTSSFQLIPGGCFTSDDDRVYCIFGSNEIQGSSVVVPEPSTLLLMGLALLGLGAVRRRLA